MGIWEMGNGNWGIGELGNWGTGELGNGNKKLNDLIK